MTQEEFNEWGKLANMQEENRKETVKFAKQSDPCSLVDYTVKELMEALKTKDPDAVICTIDEIVGDKITYRSIELVNQQDNVEYCSNDLQRRIGNIVVIF